MNCQIKKGYIEQGKNLALNYLYSSERTVKQIEDSNRENWMTLLKLQKIKGKKLKEFKIPKILLLNKNKSKGYLNKPYILENFRTCKINDTEITFSYNLEKLIIYVQAYCCTMISSVNNKDESKEILNSIELAASFCKFPLLDPVTGRPFTEMELKLIRDKWVTIAKEQYKIDLEKTYKDKLQVFFRFIWLHKEQIKSYVSNEGYNILNKIKNIAYEKKNRKFTLFFVLISLILSYVFSPVVVFGLNVVQKIATASYTYLYMIEISTKCAKFFKSNFQIAKELKDIYKMSENQEKIDSIFSSELLIINGVLIAKENAEILINFLSEKAKIPYPALALLYKQYEPSLNLTPNIFFTNNLGALIGIISNKPAKYIHKFLYNLEDYYLRYFNTVESMYHKDSLKRRLLLNSCTFKKFSSVFSTIKFAKVWKKQTAKIKANKLKSKHASKSKKKTYNQKLQNDDFFVKQYIKSKAK